MSRSLTSRRRSTPWIHRWSRPLMGAIAILGAINTGYITATKLLGGETACPTSGCEQVLSSPYATVFGLPLALYGFLAYAAMATFALVPLAIKSEEKSQFRLTLEKWTWLLLFAGATAMVIFSGYLMYVMASQFVAVYGIKSICLYCIASALFATALFVLTLIGHDWEDVGQLLFTGVIVGMVTLIATLGIYARISAPIASSDPNTPGNAGPPIVATSNQSEIQLASHLKQIGAKMYGAYWCPHCHDQKELFGKEAFSQISYIECAADGKNAKPDLCKAANIEGFPTWEINGQFYSGTQPLDKLAEVSGYKGSRNFN